MCVHHNLHRNIPPLSSRAIFPVNVLPDIIDTAPVTPAMRKAPVMYVMSTQVIQYKNNKSNNVRSPFYLHSFKVCTHTCKYICISLSLSLSLSRDMILPALNAAVLLLKAESEISTAPSISKMKTAPVTNTQVINI